MINRVLNTWERLTHTIKSKQAYLKNLPASEIDVKDLQLKQTSDLYHNKLFSVVPKDMSLDQGIFPEDQHFSNKYVFLWDTWRDLLPFKEDRWKKVMVYLPPNAKFDILNRIPGNGYALSHVPNTWKIEEQSFPPAYVQ